MIRQHGRLGWMIQINGFFLDARHLRRDVQEAAFKKRLIPYIPGAKPAEIDQAAE